MDKCIIFLLSALLVIVLFYTKNMWLSKIKKNGYLKTLFQVISFFSALATIIGFFYIYQQLELTNRQLNELNSKSELKVKPIISIDSLGPNASINTNRLGVSFNMYNVGNRVPTVYRILLVFCDDVEVVGVASGWKEASKNNYVFESTKPILAQQQIFSDALDTVGIFQIKIDRNKIISTPSYPVGWVSVAGENNKSTSYLFSLFKVREDDGKSELSFKTKDIYSEINSKNFSSLESCTQISTSSVPTSNL